METRTTTYPRPTEPSPALSNDTTNGVYLEWAGNMEADLAGYLIYYGTSSGNYNGTGADQGNSPISISTFTNYTITGLTDQATYYFNMKAVDQSNNTSAFTTERSVMVTTDIEPISNVPKTYELKQNHPNPFNPTTAIEYCIPEASRVQLEIFNLLGRRVAQLVDQKQSAGFHTVSFNASNLASGIYIYRIKAKGFVQTRKMLLLK